MTFYNDSPYSRLQHERSRVNQVLNNEGRLASVSLTWTTQGIGETLLKTVRPLNIQFTEEPSVTSGMVLDDSTELVSGRFPKVQAGVYSWQKDTNGYYIGAYLFFSVSLLGATPAQLAKDLQLTDIAIQERVNTSAKSAQDAYNAARDAYDSAQREPHYTIHHHIIFSGQAIKTLPGHLLDLDF